MNLISMQNNVHTHNSSMKNTLLNNVYFNKPLYVYTYMYYYTDSYINIYLYYSDTHLHIYFNFLVIFENQVFNCSKILNHWIFLTLSKISFSVDHLFTLFLFCYYKDDIINILIQKSSYL